MLKVMLCALALIGLGLAMPIQAQRLPITSPTVDDEFLTSTDSATLSGELATPAAAVTPTPRPQEDRDITQPSGPQKSRLALFLDENPIAPLTWYNPLQHAIRWAVDNGLSANIVVLLILFPVIASIIAASRHLIGLQGFGIYIPAVLSVAFVSTGLPSGLLFFGVVLLAASVFRTIVKRLHLQYLPRTALLLWGVSLSVLVTLFVTTYFNFNSAITLNIFPLLIIVLLTENFMESQLNSSQTQALQLTLETIGIAIVCSIIISAEPIQKLVLLQPELTIIAVAIFNFIIGKYTGLRLLEYLRFRSILDS